MRAIGWVILLSMVLVAAAPAARATSTTSPEVVVRLDDVRLQAKSVLMTSRDWLVSAYQTVQTVTGYTDDQLYGVGVGALAGLMVADWVGLGGLFSILTAVGGGWFGKWAVDADSSGP